MYASEEQYLVIPDGTTAIEPEQYKSNPCTHITFPDTLLEIGDRAFQGCSNLQSVKLPARTQIIGEEAFAGCKRLREVYIPYSVVEIGQNAFSDYHILYCETAEPPEYWYNRSHVECYSEDYAGYVDADYEQWCGDWGYLYCETDDFTGEDYIREVLRYEPLRRVMLGKKNRFMIKTDQFVRFDIYAWVMETYDHPIHIGLWREEYMIWSKTVKQLRQFVITSLDKAYRYPDSESMFELDPDTALKWYDSIFCEIWNIPYHEEEYLFYRWEIYRYVLEKLKNMDMQSRNLKEMAWKLYAEYQRRKAELASYRADWGELLYDKDFSLHK